LVAEGCNPCLRLARKCPPQIMTEIKDSIVFRDTIIFRDRIIYDSIPGDTVEVEKLIPVEVPLNVSPIRAEMKYAEAEAWVQSSILKLELRQKEQVITHILDSAEEEVTHWKEMYHNKEVTKTIKERFIPKFFKFALYYAVCLTILLLIYIILRMKLSP
jgi:hypothetical protein